jgi:hypothetical protein
LRPLSLGEILDVAFGLYRNLFLPLLLVTLITGAIPLAISVYLDSAGGPLLNLPLYFANLVLNAILGAIAAAAATFIVSESYMGRKITAGDALRRAAPFIGRLIGLGILTSFVVVLGFMLLIVPGLILVSGLALATPAMVIESQPTATGAMGRSWALTRGHRLKVFWALFAVGVLMYIPFLALGGIAAASMGVEGGPTATGVSPTFVLLTALAALITTLIWPLFYCVLTVSYYDLRVRKEAFDLEVLASGLAQA